MMSFPENSHEFFWLSDRDGYQHVYRYDYSGKLINQVTRGSWSATRIEGSDAARQTLYYTSTEVSPLQRQLYSIGFDGSNKRRITTAEGNHRVNMSPAAMYFLDRYSSVHQPVQVELWSTAGQKIRTLEANTSVTNWLATHPKLWPMPQCVKRLVNSIIPPPSSLRHAPVPGCTWPWSRWPARLHW